MTEAKDRYKQGWDAIKSIYGDVGEEVLESVRSVSPDLARYTVEFPFGDVYSRPGLDLKSREIATIAALVTLGNSPRELKAHIRGALNVGCTREEVLEVIIQMAVYAGFPAAINGIEVAGETFAQLDDE